MPDRSNGTAAGKLALFDLDNTLIDRQDAYRRWGARFVEENGLDDAAAAFMEALDRDGFATREEVFAPLRERYGLEASVEELIVEYRATYPSFVSATPEVHDALARLRAAGWKLAIVTNGPVTQHDKIAQAGFADTFDACCVSAEIGVEKPDRAIFDEAARRCGAEIDGWSEAWMVGDAAIPDVAGGAAAGLRTIWMHRGRTWDENHVRPDATAGSIEEVAELLLRTLEPR
jgi:putative hydrolase of the HAD superfamily